MQQSLLATPEAALALLDTLLQGQTLKDTQELVFRYSWQGWTYSQIAESTGYDLGHIRDIGYELWRHLTQALGEPVTKKTVQAVLRRQAYQKPNTVNQPVPDARTTETAGSVVEKRQHWGEAIDASVFYGRSQELRLLEQWVVADRCRLIALVGIGGIGKTALAAKLAEQLQGEYDTLIWQSLRNAPPIQEVLANLTQLLSDQQETGLDEGFEAQASQLMKYLRSSRCLLVLDSIEAILDGSDASKLL